MLIHFLIIGAASMLLFALYLVFLSLRACFDTRPTWGTAETTSTGLGSEERRQSLGRKQQLLGDLKELQDDFEMGKLTEDDFQELSETLRSEAKEVLREIEEQVSPHRDKATAIIRKAGLDIPQDKTA